MNVNAHPLDWLAPSCLTSRPRCCAISIAVPVPLLIWDNTDAADTDDVSTEEVEEEEEVNGAKLKALVQLVLEFKTTNSSALLK
jgi:hypothetical protein